MRALKALMVGAEDECVDVASELAEQQGISAEVFTAMAKYAATNSCEFDSVTEGRLRHKQSMESVHAESWKTDPHWAPADAIGEQLARPNGEGKETFTYAKAEVDHMRSTRGVLICDRRTEPVQKDLKGTKPLDCKWVISAQIEEM
jgi:hypothetical protein